MDKKASLKDIAAKVGVSIALVSYVLNNREKEARVGVEVAKKIRKAAVELKYQPNLIARSLKSGKTNTIGLIVADISNPFFSSMARIIEDEAAKRGYTVLFGSNDEQPAKTGPLIDTFLNRQVDGIIIAPAEGDEKNIKGLQKKGLPVVLLDRYFPSIRAAHVRIDNYNAAFDAVTVLIKNGYSRIAMLAYDTELAHMQERIKGYEAALERGKLKRKASWLLKTKPDATAEQKAAQIDRLLQKGEIDALFFATNSLAVTALKQIKAAGIKVPEQLGVISFDESDAFEFFYSPISYINQNIGAMGKAAVRLLLQSIESGDGKDSNAIIETSLVIRESSGK